MYNKLKILPTQGDNYLGPVVKTDFYPENKEKRCSKLDKLTIWYVKEVGTKE